MTKQKKNGTPNKGANKNNNKMRGGTSQPKGPKTRAQPVVTKVVKNTNKSVMGGTVKLSMEGMDAFAKYHLPLPRPVSSYTVVRNSTRAFASEKAFIFSPFNMQEAASRAGDKGDWTNCIGLAASGNPEVDKVNDQGAWTKLALPHNAASGGGWDKVTLVPAAMSIRVFNTQPLHTTTGVVYMGRANSELEWDGSTDLISEKFNRLITMQSPAVYTAAELAMNPVQIDAIPLDLSAASEFSDYYHNQASNTAFTWSDGNDIRPVGFTPLFIYNPQAINLLIEVCVEFRVRYNPDSLMSETQKHYSPAPMSTWDNLMRDAFNSNKSGVHRIPGHNK